MVKPIIGMIIVLTPAICFVLILAGVNGWIPPTLGLIVYGLFNLSIYVTIQEYYGVKK